MRLFFATFAVALIGLASETASAQTADRTIDEIKTETLARARPRPNRRLSRIGYPAR